ncbi:MAG: hypothetical protein ACK5LT_13345 [Lachnospirales bacterium]
MIELNEKTIEKYLPYYRYPKEVLSGSGIDNSFDSMGVDIPFVFYHNGLFYMLHTGFDGRGYQSALATSENLIDWKFKGIILGRNNKSWNKNGGAATWIIKESDSIWDVPKLKKINNKYWMVYHAYPDTGYEAGPAEIGLAWCDDEELLEWNYLEKPVFSWRDGGKWEQGGLYKACIIENNGVWHLFYNAKDTQERWIEQTGMAYSKDLFNWTRCKFNPIIKVNKESWDERFVSDPCIVRDKDLWINYYFGYGKVYEDGYAHAQGGLAFSKDLIKWEKVKEPILPYGHKGSIDSGHAHKSSVLFYNGTLYHFYCGTRPFKNGDKTKIFGEYRTICLAKKGVI